jgi:hypothetical protein
MGAPNVLVVFPQRGLWGPDLLLLFLFDPWFPLPCAPTVIGYLLTVHKTELIDHGLEPPKLWAKIYVFYTLDISLYWIESWLIEPYYIQSTAECSNQLSTTTMKNVFLLALASYTAFEKLLFLYYKVIGFKLSWFSTYFSLIPTTFMLPFFSVCKISLCIPT